MNFNSVPIQLSSICWQLLVNT